MLYPSNPWYFTFDCDTTPPPTYKISNAKLFPFKLFAPIKRFFIYFRISILSMDKRDKEKACVYCELTESNANLLTE